MPPWRSSVRAYFSGPRRNLPIALSLPVAALHLDLVRGENLHHIAEAAFKALGLATRHALTVVGGGIPSTKGTL
jgi:imidazoleglycerol phosphate dehydratase HisB